MKKIYTMVAAIAVLGLSANAALILNDPGFSGSFTDVGTDFDNTDSANFDKWVFQDDTGSIPREFVMQPSGGNPDGYADGSIGGSYKRSFYQGVTDNKVNTGLTKLVFDLNLNLDAGGSGISARVWGVETLSGATFVLDNAPGTSGSNGNAILLKSQDFTSNTSGWEEQAVLNIDFGTGYDLVIIGFQSNNNHESATVGIDNVSVIPEPATLGMVATAGALLMLLRRRLLR